MPCSAYVASGRTAQCTCDCCALQVTFPLLRVDVGSAKRFLLHKARKLRRSLLYAAEQAWHNTNAQLVEQYKACCIPRHLHFLS